MPYAGIFARNQQESTIKRRFPHKIWDFGAKNGNAEIIARFLDADDFTGAIIWTSRRQSAPTREKRRRMVCGQQLHPAGFRDAEQ